MVEIARSPEAVAEAARLLHDFNTEYDDPTPGPEELTRILHARIAGGDTVVLLARDDSRAGVGVAVARLLRSVWSDAYEAYLAELYVVPARRGQGHGRALVTAFLDLAQDRGADYAYVITSEDDHEAQRLYRAAGFRRTEGDDGPLLVAYEQGL